MGRGHLSCFALKKNEQENLYVDPGGRRVGLWWTGNAHPIVYVVVGWALSSHSPVPCLFGLANSPPPSLPLL